jgi:hypothetical protein
MHLPGLFSVTSRLYVAVLPALMTTIDVQVGQAAPRGRKVYGKGGNALRARAS